MYILERRQNPTEEFVEHLELCLQKVLNKENLISLKKEKKFQNKICEFKTL